jgi:amidase
VAGTRVELCGAGDGAVQRVTLPATPVYRLDAGLSPIATVAANEPFVVCTQDASSGNLINTDLAPTAANFEYLRHSPPFANPVTGPVAITGVRARGRVEVKILAIEPAAAGAFWSRPGNAPFADSREWSDLAQPIVQRVEHRDNRAVVNRRLSWELAPMIGTIGCAPEWEALASLRGQGSWGGNLDVADVRNGATLYVNAFHDGGLLFIGDVHGCQGDGEFGGTGDETSAEVVLSVAPADGSLLDYPRVETPERLVALWVDRPLEEAVRGAIRHLMRWMVDELGFRRKDAYLLISLHPQFRIHVYQMTAIHGLGFTAGASLPITELR